MATPGRTELLLGVLSGGALLRAGDNGTLWKYVVGKQYPDFWYRTTSLTLTLTNPNSNPNPNPNPHHVPSPSHSPSDSPVPFPVP